MEKVLKIKSKIEEIETDYRYGLTKKEMMSLGKWFKEEMSKNTLFPSPGYILTMYPDAKGSIEQFKQYAKKHVEEVKDRYIKSNTNIPDENIYPIKGSYFWNHRGYYYQK